MIAIPKISLDIATEPIARVEADWLIAGVWANGSFFGPAAELDAATGGVLARLREAGDLTGKHLELVPLLNPSGIASKRLLVVGLGKREGATRGTIHDAAAAAARHATGKKFGTIALAAPSSEFTLAAAVGLARVPGARHSQGDSHALRAERLLLGGGDAAALPRTRAKARALWLARELVNTPPCDLYPETFATVAAESGRTHGFEVEVWDESRLAAERMGSLLGVAPVRSGRREWPSCVTTAIPAARRSVWSGKA